METVTIPAEDGYKLSLAVFEAESPRGYIQFIHGMEEHKERYEAFADYLCRAGFTVVTSDMRGHGVNAPLPGFFKEKDGHLSLLSDQNQITDYIRKRFQAQKVSLFSHSMGTIIARDLLRSQSDRYEKIVMSGYPNYPGKWELAKGFLMAKACTVFHGPKYHSPLLEHAAVGHYNDSIANPETAVDWICTDRNVVQEYIKDPYCGHGFTVSAFHDLFMLLVGMENPAKYERVNGNLPILLLRGSEDPCTGFDKGAKDSMNRLKQAGFSNIRSNTYAGMRHELLNERGHEKVWEDVVEFYRGDENG